MNDYTFHTKSGNFAQILAPDIHTAMKCAVKRMAEVGITGSIVRVSINGGHSMQIRDGIQFDEDSRAGIVRGLSVAEVLG